MIDRVELLLKGLISLMVLCLLAVVVLIPVGIYMAVQESRRPTFELKKDDWVCTQSHEETSTTYVMAGKVMIPMTSTNTICDQWSRKK